MRVALYRLHADSLEKPLQRVVLSEACILGRRQLLRRGRLLRLRLLEEAVQRPGLLRRRHSRGLIHPSGLMLVRITHGQLRRRRHTAGLVRAS